MLEPAPKNPWRVTSRRTVYQNPWSSVIEDQLVDDNGQTGLYGYFARKDWVIVCPIHADGSITMVRQWRHAFQSSSWELPCGACDGEDPLVAGQRELAEEAGLTAGSWQAAGSFHNSDARVAGLGHVFYARECATCDVAADKDASESDLIAETIPWSEVLAACDDGRITNIATLFVLNKLQLTLLQG